jgi:hypothetical protein
MADLDLQAIHNTLVDIARHAGRMILSANPSDIDQGTKLNCKFRGDNPYSISTTYFVTPFDHHLRIYMAFTPRCPSMTTQKC